MKRPFFDKWGVRYNGATLHTVKLSSGTTYRSGVVHTPFGFAWVAEISAERTTARFIHDGTEYSVTWHRSFTDRGIATVVGRWVWSIVQR